MTYRAGPTDLPADFLSTPFGAALRPTIDNMFRRPGSGPSTPRTATPTSSLIQSVAERATAPSIIPQYLPTPVATPQPQSGAMTVSAPLQICTNVQHFQSIISSHRAVSAFFTSRTCPPCRIVEPVFEDLAVAKASNGVAFVKVDISSMMSGSIASAYGVRATPTFLFFLDGKRIAEVKGANAPELRSQVDLLLFQAYPREWLNFIFTARSHYCSHSSSTCHQEAAKASYDIHRSHPFQSGSQRLLCCSEQASCIHRRNS